MLINTSDSTTAEHFQPIFSALEVRSVTNYSFCDDVYDRL